MRPPEQIEVQRHPDGAVPQVNGIGGVTRGSQPTRQRQGFFALGRDDTIDEEGRGGAVDEDPFEELRAKKVRLTRHRIEPRPADAPDQPGEDRGATEPGGVVSNRVRHGAPEQELPDQGADQSLPDRRGVERVVGFEKLGDADGDGPSREGPRRRAAREQQQQAEGGVEENFVNERPRRADVMIRFDGRGQRQPREPCGFIRMAQRRAHHGHGDQHHEPKQRVDPPKPTKEEGRQRPGVPQRLGLRVGDDEPGDHEEEIDAGEAEPAERAEKFASDAEIVLPSPHVNAEDEQTRDAAKPLQIVQLGVHGRGNTPSRETGQGESGSTDLAIGFRAPL